jgi:hypothetical protein
VIVREAVIGNSGLKSLVRIGEGYHLEFKRRVSSPHRLAREAIAFANTWGGTILVGVGDDGSLLGVKDVQEELYDLERALTIYSSPAISFSWKTVEVRPRREVIVLEIPESKSKPHFLHNGQSADREAFIRIDDQTVAASDEVIALMASEGDHEGARFEFGDTELMLLRFLEEYHRVTVAQFARLADIPIAEASEILVLLTRANVLQVQPSEKEDFFVFQYQEEGGDSQKKEGPRATNGKDRYT